MSLSQKIVFLIFVLVAGLIGLIYLYFPFGHNESNFHYFGMVVREGGLPYLDFVDRRGPLGLYSYGLPMLIFGHKAWGYRVFDLLVMGFSFFGLYQVLRMKKYTPGVSFLAVAVCLIYYISYGPGNTGDVTNIIILCMAWMLYLVEIGHKPIHFVLFGLISSLTFWVKPTAIVIFIFLIIYLLISRKFNPKNRPKTFLLIGLASLLGFLLGYVFLLLTQTLLPYFQKIYTDPLTFYTDISFLDRFNRQAFQKITNQLLHNPFFHVAVLVGWVWPHKFLKSNSIFFWLGLGAACMIFIESKYYLYHFSMIMPVFFIGIASFLQMLFNLSNVPTWGKNVGIIIFLLIMLISPFAKVILPFKQMIQTAASQAVFFQVDGLQEQYIRRKQVVKYLSPLMAEDDQLFVLGSDSGIFVELNKSTSCRFPFHGYELFFDYSGRDLPPHRLQWRNEVLSNIFEKIPDWLLIDKQVKNVFSEPIKGQVTVFLTEKYQLTQQRGGYEIYRRIKQDKLRMNHL